MALNTYITEEIPRELLGDPFKLKQILSNLIGNAIKFTSKGSISIFVTNYGEKSLNSICLLFEVRDTGIGIPKDARQILFKRFSQGLANLMNGKIWYESEPGKGSSFFFTCLLDVNEVSEDKLKSVNLSREVIQSGDFLKILLAEDDRVNQLVIAEYAKKLN